MSIKPDIVSLIRAEYVDLSPLLDERRIRLWCSARARSYDREHGHGGVTAVYKATCVSRSRIYEGLAELDREEILAVERVRQTGGGRKNIEVKQPQVRDALDALVEPTSKGDPESPLRWTCKSAASLSKELAVQGYTISRSKVHNLLCAMNYSLQKNKKDIEGGNHPDRNEQFEHINKETSKNNC